MGQGLEKGSKKEMGLKLNGVKISRNPLYKRLKHRCRINALVAVETDPNRFPKETSRMIELANLVRFKSLSSSVDAMAMLNPCKETSYENLNASPFCPVFSSRPQTH